MIPIIFNKSKPINLLVAMLLVGLSGVLIRGYYVVFGIVPIAILDIGAIIIAVLSVVIVDFMIKKYTLSNQNSFVILYYSICFFFFWSTHPSVVLLCSQLFLLLSFRKIISLKNQKNVTQKIFDAAFWICIATLFHFWAILFLAVLYLAILFYVGDYYKNWLVPMVSGVVVLLIKMAIQIVFLQKIIPIDIPEVNLGLSQLLLDKNLITTLVFGVLILISMFFFRQRIRQKGQQQKLTYVLVLAMLFVAITVVIVSVKSGLSAVLFLFYPLAILWTIFIEKITQKWLKALLVYGSVLLLGGICLW